jgi:RHS repeat-associated protein
MGQVKVQRQCIEGLVYEMGFDYDLLGRWKTLTYPDSEIVTYRYDTAGRLHDMSGYVNSMSYDAAGNLTEIKYANQTKTTHTYDPKRQWLNDATISKGSITLYQAGYEYFANGLVQTTNSSTNKMNLTYSYDDLNRLTSVGTDLSQTFHYDATGNMDYNSEVGTYTYLSSAGTRCGAVTSTPTPCPHAVKSTLSPQNYQEFKYDANGNLTFAKRTVSGVYQERSIEWNADNRPFMIQAYDGNWTQLRYNAWGQRVYRERNGKVTQYYSDYMDLSYPIGGGTLDKIQYYYAGAMLVARKDTTGKYWYHQDMLDSTRLLTNHNGQVVQRYDYAPFGDTSSTLTSFSNDIQYTGHRGDEDNDLIYMNARYYDPQLARFISADSVIPADGAQALNRYSYVYNNPVLYSDPTGHGPDAGVQGNYDSNAGFNDQGGNSIRNNSGNGAKTMAQPQEILTVVITRDYGVGSHAALLISNHGDPILYDPGGGFGEDLLIEENGELVHARTGDGI